MAQPVNGTTQPEATTEFGPGGVPKGAKTSDFYRTFDIPERFDNPDGCNASIAGNPIFSCMSKIETPGTRNPRPDEWFEGYNTIPQNPLYRTTNASYGNKPPSVHTMPTSFHAKSQQFSQHLGKCGMYRNFSMNTALDQSRV